MRTMIKTAIIYGRVPANASLRAWVGTCLLLIVLVLAGCSGMSASTSSPASTPLALPTSKVTPTVIPSSPTTDWTTYHRDNTRAGFVANTQRLIGRPITETTHVLVLLQTHLIRTALRGPGAHNWTVPSMRSRSLLVRTYLLPQKETLYILSIARQGRCNGVRMSAHRFLYHHCLVVILIPLVLPALLCTMQEQV